MSDQEDQWRRFRQRITDAENILEASRLSQREADRLFKAAEPRLDEPLPSLEQVQRQFDEVQGHIDESKRLYREAEHMTEPSTLFTFLEGCHMVSLALKPDFDVEPGPDPKAGPEDDDSGPQSLVEELNDCFCPTHIKPWVDFPTMQETIWATTAGQEALVSPRQFPSLVAFKESIDLVKDVDYGSIGAFYENDVVVQGLKHAFSVIENNDVLRQQFRWEGNMQFHDFYEHRSSRSACAKDIVAGSKHPSQRRLDNGEIDLVAHAQRRVRRYAYEQYIFSMHNRQQTRPVAAMEFATPVWVTLPTMIEGCKEMRPAEDVIGKKPDNLEDECKKCLAKPIAQVYSYMIDIGVRNGWFSTGEAYIFLHIPETDPSTVLYHLSVPNLDVAAASVAGTVNGFQYRRTATGQLLAFLLNAQCTPIPSQAWYNVANRVPFWGDVVKALERNPNPTAGITTLQANYRCHLQAYQQTRRAETIITRQYCTIACMRGLVNGGTLDRKCPNVRAHGTKKHPFAAPEFLRHLKQQLDENTDRGIEPLYIRGSTGFMLKAVLKSHGYTVFLKATGLDKDYKLIREGKTYSILHTLQGNDIPVCLGDIELRRPYWYYGKAMTHALVLGWAGHRISSETEMIWDIAQQQKQACMSKLEARKVMYLGSELGSVLWNEELGRTLLIDFEDVRLTALSSEA